MSDDGAPSLRLEGHVYVVTGATGTLGRAVASALLARGARVAVPYRSPERWREVEPGLQGGDRVWAAAGDITDPASTVRFVEAAAQHFGRIDGLAAIAGAYSDSGRFEEAPVTEWLAMMGANLTPTFTGCRAVLPYLLERGGSVVTVTSRRALEMAAGATAYVVAKSAVLSLTRALAAENRDRGVRFNCVAPGIIDTPDNRAAMPHADLTRWTSPAALAEVIAFLLSPASAPVTGAVIPADLPA